MKSEGSEPKPRRPALGRGAPITSGFENQQKILAKYISDEGSVLKYIKYYNSIKNKKFNYFLHVSISTLKMLISHQGNAK